MSLKALTDEELLGEIHSMEQALRQYHQEVERRVLENASPLRTPPNPPMTPDDTARAVLDRMQAELDEAVEQFALWLREDGETFYPSPSMIQRQEDIVTLRTALLSTPVATQPTCVCSEPGLRGTHRQGGPCLAPQPTEPCDVCGRKHPGPGTIGVCDR